MGLLRLMPDGLEEIEEFAPRTASSAGILPQAQVVVFTAGTLANGTLVRFVRLVDQDAMLLWDLHSAHLEPV